MKPFIKIRKFLCRIGIHNWVEHYHKTQEGNFFCKHCGKFMDEDEKRKYLWWNPICQIVCAPEKGQTTPDTFKHPKPYCLEPMPFVGLKPPRKGDVLSGQGDARQNFYHFLLPSTLVVISRKAAKLYWNLNETSIAALSFCGAKAPQKGRCPFRTGRRTAKFLPFFIAFNLRSHLEEGGETIL